MKTSDCERCKHHERRKWSHVHYCRNYHPIGMTHGYAYCLKYQKRCSQIKKCEEEGDLGLL